MSTVSLTAVTPAYPFITERIKGSVYAASDIARTTPIQSQIDVVTNHPSKIWRFTGLEQGDYIFSLDIIDNLDILLDNISILDVTPSDLDAYIGATQSDITRLELMITSDFSGTVDTLTFNPGTQTTNTWFRANAGAGVYIHFLSAPDTPIEVLSEDGQTDFIFNVATGFYKKSSSPQDLSIIDTKITEAKVLLQNEVSNINLWNDESIFPDAVIAASSSVAVTNPYGGGNTIKVLAGQLQDGSYVRVIPDNLVFGSEMIGKTIHFTWYLEHLSSYTATVLSRLRVGHAGVGYSDFSSTQTIISSTLRKYDIEYTIDGSEEWFGAYVQAENTYTPTVDTIFKIKGVFYNLFDATSNQLSVKELVDRKIDKIGENSINLTKYDFLTEVLNGAVLINSKKIKVPTGSTGDVSYFASKVNDYVGQFPAIWEKKGTKTLIEFVIDVKGGHITTLNFLRVLCNKDSGTITDPIREKISDGTATNSVNRYKISAYYIPDETTLTNATLRPYLQIGYGGVTQTSDFFLEVIACNMALVPNGDNGFNRNALTLQAANDLSIQQAVSISTSSLVNLINTTAYVSTTGNDSTAELNNSYKPFRTPSAAYDALISGGNTGVVQVGDGRFTSPASSKYRTGIELRGNGKPRTDMQVTVVKSDDFPSGYGKFSVISPTRLVGGTIFEGQIVIPYYVEHVTFKNFGIDCGSFVNNNQEGMIIAQYGSFTPGDPLIDDPDGIHRLQTSTRPRMGVVVKDLTVLLKTAPQPAHCILIENAVNPIVRDCSTYFGQAGIVLKTIGGTVSGCDGHGHGSYTMIAKGNRYSHGLGITISNFTCESIQPFDGAGLSVGTENENLCCNISNGTFIGTKTDIVKFETGFGVVGVLSTMLSVNVQSSSLQYFLDHNTVYFKVYNGQIINY